MKNILISSAIFICLIGRASADLIITGNIKMERGGNTSTIELDDDGNVNIISKGLKHGDFVILDSVEAQTTDDTQTTLDAITLLDDNIYHIEAWVVGVKSDGSQKASYSLTGTFFRTNGGATTKQGTATILHAEETNNDWKVQFTVSGNDLRISVTGIASTTIDWSSTIKYVNISN